jgi:hypothetical protein
VPARESPTRVRPVGPGRRFSARDPASPGVACSTSVPRRARLANARQSGARHPSQCPEAHRPSAPSQYPIAVTARRLDSRHPSQYPEAHGPSVPRARLDASWWRCAACLPSRAERPASQPASPGSPAERVSACPGRPPDPQRRGPSPHAQPSILHRATESARVPIPTQARASATGGCGTGQQVGLGAERRSGGDQRLHSPTAWLPPGHEPGAGGGVATTAQQQKVWPLGPEDFWIDDAISESRRGLVGSNAAEAGQRRAYEASRAQRSDRPPIAKRAIRERYGKR